MVRKATVGIIYKVPSFSKKDFLDVFESLLSQVAKEKKKVVLIGDFNIDLLNPDDRVDFLNAMFSSYLYPLVTIPSIITHSSPTLIDNIFVDGQLLNDCIADVLVTDGSDHLMLKSKIDSLKRRPPKDEIKHRDLSENSLKNLAVNLEHVDFSEVFKWKCAEKAYNLFMDIFLAEFDNCCPLKKVKKKTSESMDDDWYPCFCKNEE